MYLNVLVLALSINHLRSDAGGVACACDDRRIWKNPPSNMALHARDGMVHKAGPACVDSFLSSPTAHSTTCAKCKSLTTSNNQVCKSFSNYCISTGNILVKVGKVL